MKGTTIFFLSILLITTGCKRLDQTTDDLITVDVTNNSFPKKELALQDFMDVEYIPLETNDDFVNQGDRKSTRLNSSHDRQSRMPSSA